MIAEYTEGANSNCREPSMIIETDSSLMVTDVMIRAFSGKKNQNNKIEHIIPRGIHGNNKIQEASRPLLGTVVQSVT